ncbi:hypothetical protein [Alteromonas sp. PRIM-21]|uniref:hypothetical protein n=1 Tax=Alteromonas sp. PRIM-21 TaxID=1454978 RepID=UPI0022B99C08|nr:hypothetical protein [Alteromonas sp. PRIM-21]MCZ8528788.1 hypothetical protein [Alteromonas sp. PRIM-21]
MDLFSVLQAYRDILVVIALTLSILFYFSYTNWESLRLWWKNVKYNNILFPKTRKLAKSPDMNGDWFHSENVVCRDYDEHYSKVSKDGDFYDACKEYLAIVGESGRRPLGAFMLLGLFAVLVLEAWGFSYTMSGFIDLSASENTRVIMTGIVAIAFAVILAFLTHLMGHELYRNGIIKRIRNNWQTDKSPQKPSSLDAISKIPEIGEDSDADNPMYKRRLDRLDVSSPSVKHTFTILAVLAIVIIGVIITFVRVKTLEVAQTQDAMCVTGSETPSVGAVSIDDLYGTANPPPPIAVEESKAAREQGESEICKATKEGSWATFGMLAILFLVLQAFATWVSFKFGFVGNHSKVAWQNTHKYKTKGQYESAMDSKARAIAQRAQKTLSNLQSRMAKKLSGETMNDKVDRLINTASERTFMDFLEEEHEQSLTNRNRRTRTTLSKNSEHSTMLSSQQEATPKSAPEVPSSTLSDEEMEAQLLKEAEPPALSDEEVEKQLLAEMQKKKETPEEQRERLLAKLKAEGKI